MPACWEDGSFSGLTSQGSRVRVNLQEFQNAMLLPRFANFLESMGISTEDIGILFTVMDSDRSGLIDLDEFVQVSL
ncbi:CACNA1C [Symbiodinium natans]|uniref:CACNA1C protein n=1 Tax=Symbiodinium natans TaxID=878477 RepID=A0A812QX60_9DINO|nr:CACNA1C [Symbiodinium natans]